MSKYIAVAQSILGNYNPKLPVRNPCQNYTSTAHSPQRTVKTLTQVEAKVEDGDYERRREDGDLPFPKLKSCIIIGH